MADPVREIAGRMADHDRRLRAQESGSRLRAALLALEGDVTNVRKFGTDGAAVQAASTEAGDGGIIRVPPGIYMFTLAAIAGETILQAYPNQTWWFDPGAIFKVADNFGNYRAFFGMGNPSTYSGQWALYGATIDQNAANSNALDVPNMSTYPKCVLYLGSYVAGSSVTVKDCRFLNGDNVNTCYVYADTLDISSNQFIGTGVAASAVHDHSTIYSTTTVANGVQKINDNLFEGAATFGAIAAIETHGGTQTITGNTVTGMMAGGNLTGVGTVATNGITCVGNTVTGCLDGFTLYAMTPASTPTRSVVWSNNAITIDRDYWDAIAGISPIASGFRLGIMTEAIDGLTIANNIITYLPATTFGSGDNNSCGINLVNDATDLINNLQILDNTIVAPIAAGIRIDMTIKRGRVSGNITIDPAQSTDASLGGANTPYGACVMLGHTFEDFTVADNMMIDTRGTHVAIFCVYSNPTVATNCHSRHNDIRLLDAAAQICPFYPAANTAGVAFHIEEETPAGNVPFFHTLRGSTVKNRATGALLTQVAGTVGNGGTTWKPMLGLGLTTTGTAPGAGGGGALPATPLGYVTVSINGTDRQIAYY